MAKLVDACVSQAHVRKDVWIRIPLRARPPTIDSAPRVGNFRMLARRTSASADNKARATDFGPRALCITAQATLDVRALAMQRFVESDLFVRGRDRDGSD